MGKRIYGIGFFLSALFLSIGLYTSYYFDMLGGQILELSNRVKKQEMQYSEAASGNIPNTTVYTFEAYDPATGGYSQNQYRLISYSSDNIVLRQTKDAPQTYLLKEKDGYVIVYLEDGKTIYEYTAIAIQDLPFDLQEAVNAGKTVESQEELYSFLENYSS